MKCKNVYVTYTEKYFKRTFKVSCEGGGYIVTKYINWRYSTPDEVDYYKEFLT